MRKLAWVLMAITSAGCAPATIYRQHAALHGCREKDVTVGAVGDSAFESTEQVSRFRAMGCGHDDVYYCRYGACQTPRKVVLDRHSAEFGCSPGEVQVRSLGGGAWLANGCGTRRTYNCLWATDALRCVAETERG